MTISILQILILAAIQGICELIPVSSSAHVIFAEKLMGIDPTTPEMTMLLVMLHTGTMLAVIVYFWKSWKSRYFSSVSAFKECLKITIAATAMTGIVGLILKHLIEKIFMAGSDHAEVERLFGNSYIISASLAVVGLLIIFSAKRTTASNNEKTVGFMQALYIGAVQGLCLPFRGFSRSGSTISTGLLLGLNKERVEEFSFALAVVITPALIIKEYLRLVKDRANDVVASGTSLMGLAGHSLIGMAFSFIAGLVALRWLSNWLESGRWQFFGYYCLFAAAVMLASSIFIFAS